jgi:hypothetical protein
MNTYRMTLLLIVLALLLASCSPTTPTLPDPTGAPADPTSSASPAADTPVVSPTPAPSPTAQAPQVILLAYGDSQVDQESVGTALAALAAADGLHFDAPAAPSDARLDGAQIVAALPGVEGLGDLARSHPETHFIALESSGLQPTDNISVLSQTGFRSRLFFAAGYLGALITPDWRVGVLMPAGEADEAQVLAALANGSAFFCGLCRPAYPPYESYPLAATANPTSEAEIQAAVDQLVGRGVETIFIAPGAGSDALYAYLAQKNVQVVGTTPPPASLAEAWVVSLLPGWDAALEALWPNALAGEPGQEVALPVAARFGNDERLSAGRLRLFEEMLADLNADYIDPAAPGP